MIRLHVRKGLLGTDGVETLPVYARPGLTAQALAFEVANHLPRSVAIECAVNGRRLNDDELDDDLPDGSDVMLLPITSSGIEVGAILVQAIIAAAVSFGVSYVISLITPRPRPDGLGQDRGDESSPTYAWDGIQTNYGQGFPVPWVYGRHAVGGQVIYTDVYAANNTVGLDDRLRIVLALCEGPVARIGDTVAADINNLGAITPPGGVTPSTYSLLPSEIRVNGNALINPTQVTQVWEMFVTPWQSLTATPQAPAIGTQVAFYNLGQYSPTLQTRVGTGTVFNYRDGNVTRPDVVITSGRGPNAGEFVVAGLNPPQFDPGPPPGYELQHDWSQVILAGSATRLSEVPGVRAWIRPGNMDQTPLPGDAFPGAISTFSPNASLNENDDQFVYTYSATDEVQTIAFVLVFPSGLFATSSSGSIVSASVTFDFEWRRVGEQSWRAWWDPDTQAGLPVSLTITEASNKVVARTFRGSTRRNVDAPIYGPIEVRVRRRSQSGGATVSTAAVWRNVSVASPQTLTYPRVALLGLELGAGSRFAGGLPDCYVRVDGSKVRVWDATNGWSAPTWDVPAAPFNFNTYPPGRNPAWILLDFLLAPWGLGRWLTEDDVDLPSFRRWAAFCDDDPSPASPWNEAAFCCDVVGDAPRPAWEWVLAICAAGRAAPIAKNGKISVSYQYRDAHGDAGVSVPAKSAVQLITSGNCEEVQVTWLPKANRPTAYLFQFLNETALYAQDVLPVEDSEGTLNDPANLQPDTYRPETVQAYGVTRPSQLYREGMFRHRVQRLIRRELTFRTGPWALAAEVGDLIQFEHETLRPFGADVPTAMSVAKTATATNQIEVDHTVVGATQVVVRDINGVAQTRTITAITISGGISRLTVSGSPVTIVRGAACVVGLTSKLVETYEVVSITLGQDLKREVRCLQWVPAVHDPMTPAMYSAEGIDATESTPSSYLRQPVQEDDPDAEDVQVAAQPDGTHRITWRRPIARSQSRARVYVRGATSTWQVIDETSGDEVQWIGAAAGQAYRVAVCLERVDGNYQLPEQAVVRDVVVEEFAALIVPAPSNTSATDAADHVAVKWDDIGMRDVAGYELRVGGCWSAAKTIYAGRQPAARLEQAPYGGTLLVAARTIGGTFGQIARIAAPAWRPYGTAVVASLDDLATTPAGTHSGTVYSGGQITLTAGTLDGTYTGPETLLGFQAAAYWQVSCEASEIELLTVDALAFTIGSGEALWRTLDGRPASPLAPGIDWQTTVDDLALAIDDLPSSFLVTGNVGEPGSHTRVAVESRYYANGAWSSWATHADQYRVASRMQARVRLLREDIGYTVAVARLRYAVNI
jgi:hypothetical protein